MGTALRHVVQRELPGATVTVTTRAEFDIQYGDWRALPVAGHDWVLNAAGLINRRDADLQALWTVNAAFPHALAALCRECGARMVHFSTDCVFDGRPGPRDERSPADAGDPYGRSKAAGEPDSALVMRTSIIGPEQRRFYNLLCWALRQDSIDGFTNHLWNGVTTVALARAIVRLIRDGDFLPGLRHVHAEDTTKHDLLADICRCFGHPAALRRVAADRPRDTRLATLHAEFLASLQLPPREQQLRELVALSTRAGAWRP